VLNESRHSEHKQTVVAEIQERFVEKPFRLRITGVVTTFGMTMKPKGNSQRN